MLYMLFYIILNLLKHRAIYSFMDTNICNFVTSYPYIYKLFSILLMQIHVYSPWIFSPEIFNKINFDILLLDCSFVYSSSIAIIRLNC